MNQKLLSGVMREADVPHDFVLFIARINLHFLLLEVTRLVEKMPMENPHLRRLVTSLVNGIIKC
jgi:hypothetical protein